MDALLRVFTADFILNMLYLYKSPTKYAGRRFAAFCKGKPKNRMQLSNFKTSIKGKIILAFLVSCIALAGSYWVNKTAFGEIRKSVADLSDPNKKLIVVNSIFTEINETEKLFRNLVTHDNDPSLKAFLAHSKNMASLSDSLAKLCTGNTYQTSLIDSINRLFKVREHLLLNYAEFRRVLKNDSSVLEQTRLLDSIVTVSAPRIDSTVLTNEQKNIVTRIDSIEVISPEEKRGFWRKLFKASKREPTKIKQIIREEINTKVDTLLRTQKDDVSLQIQKIITDILEEQKVRRKKFFTHETQLASFENSFNSKITTLLSEVNRAIVHQTELTYNKADAAVGKSINRIYIIISIFIVATALISMLMLADITKSNKYKLLLEKAKAAAEENSLSRQRFLSNMSHEIRTPLQSIIGYTEQISQQDKPDAQQVKAIRTSSEHLLGVINEILDYNRIISGIFTFEHTDFEIKKVVQEVIAILQYQATEKGLELVYEEADLRENYLKGDAFRLRQILLNLIGNALKFTAKGSVTLKITMEQRGDKEAYCFLIEDTGIGIAPDMLEIIFNRFERVNLPDEHRYSGTGLGLGIVKALVEGQGGTISARSEPDSGSCFLFEIPYDKGQPAVLLPDKNEQVVSTFEGHVWLVDDDKWILNLCNDILNKHGIRHTAFNTPEDLLNHAYTVPPAVLLIDIRMPGINGLQLFERIQHRFSVRPLFVALTAQALPEERVEILEHGFDHILLKPFMEQDLLSLFGMKAAPVNGNPAVNKAVHWDAGILGQMLDKEEVESILTQYLQETTQDLQMLEAAIVSDAINETSRLLHRLSGRTSQIGATALGASLRKLEIEIHNNQIIRRKPVYETLDKVKELMVVIEGNR